MSTGKAWSPEDDVRLLSMHAAGEKPSVIAKSLGRPTSSIPSRLGTLGAKRRGDSTTSVRMVVSKHPNLRACMCCGARFNSAGPHNRLCNRCRKTDISPYAP